MVRSYSNNKRVGNSIMPICCVVRVLSNIHHGEPMKSWQLDRGGRESLHLVDISEPKPGPDQILVRTKAVSLNYRDKLMMEDKYLHPVVYPLVPGSDLAGEVVAVGPGVFRFKGGDQGVSIIFRPK